MEKYSHIIVGAGAAGCVLAYRLSADQRNRVLLLEAGGEDDSLMIGMPKGFPKLIDDDRYVRQFDAEPCEGNANIRELWPKGKVLGGSSSINGTLYSRGHPDDYDAWAKLGGAQWSWKHILASFRAIEDHLLGDDGRRGAGGPLHVSPHPHPNPLSDAIIAAGAAVGLKAREDVNQEDQEGIGYVTRTIKKGVRVSASRAFLRPVRHRRNLTVATHHFVERLLIEGRRVVGVCSRQDGESQHIRCDGEVILSAGSIQSPQILQLSGIGPGAHLRSFGIPVVVDIPGVGQNLREHWMAIVQYSLKQPISQNFEFRGMRPILHGLRYLLTKRGIMSTSSHEVNAFFRTDPSLNRPDAQMIAAPMSVKRGSATDRFAFEDKHGFQIMTYQMRPQSRGHIMIQSPDPRIQPKIQANYLAEEVDRKATVGAVRFVRRLAAQTPLKRYVREETLPGTSARTDDEILEVVRRTGNCVYHAVGTCRMGTDSAAVVDFDLRVSGMSGLRVVDASVFPCLVSGQTNGPVMAVAWRAADLILAEAH